MNHFNVSLIKSALRILGCLTSIPFAITGMLIPCICVLSGSLIAAEFLGILEEKVDKRKEE